MPKPNTLNYDMWLHGTKEHPTDGFGYWLRNDPQDIRALVLTLPELEAKASHWNVQRFRPPGADGTYRYAVTLTTDIRQIKE